MFGIVVFVLALAAMFALKALSISKTYDAAVSKSTAFCWMAAKPQDAHVAEQGQAAAAEPAEKPASQVHVLRRRPSAA